MARKIWPTGETPATEARAIASDVFVDDAAGETGPVGRRRHPTSGAAFGIRVALIATAVLASLPLPARNAEAATFPLACCNVYVDLDRYAHCARRDGVMVRIDPAYLARMRFHGRLTEIVVDGVGWLWARRDGLALPVFILDNGPDPFASGLVRAWHAGKVAFYDRRLRRVLTTAYDWSFPFNARGEALVCQGCRSDGRVPSSMVGGLWGLIDRRGRIAMPLAKGGQASERYLNQP